MEPWWEDWHRLYRKRVTFSLSGKKKKCLNLKLRTESDKNITKTLSARKSQPEATSSPAQPTFVSPCDSHIMVHDHP